MAKNSIQKALIRQRLGNDRLIRDAGRAAFCEGGSESSCPLSDPVLQDMWLSGFRDAKTEAEAS